MFNFASENSDPQSPKNKAIFKSINIKSTFAISAVYKQLPNLNNFINPKINQAKK